MVFSRKKLATMIHDQGWGISVCAFLYFISTTAHGLLWFDSGELALAAHSYGIGHPPGQIFYTLLAAGSSWLPGSSLLWLNLLSVFSITLSIPALFRMVSIFKLPKDRITYLVILAWILLYPIWDQATRIEVYALAYTTGIWSVVYWMEALSTQSHEERHSYFIKSAWFWAACAGSNAVFALAFLLSFLCSYLLYKPTQIKTWIFHTLGASLLFYTYYIYAIFYSDGFIWGQHQQWSDIWYFFTGKDYRHTVHNAWHLVPTHLSQWLQWAFYHGTLLWILLALSFIGLTRVRMYLIYILPISILCVLFPLSYQNYWPEVPDFNGYLIPTLSLLSLVIITGLHHLKNRNIALLLVLILSLSNFISITPPHQRTRTHHHLALTLAHDWLQQLPNDSILFVQSDHWIFPLLYAQEIQKVRTDVVIFNMGFARSSWYWQWLQKKHPSLTHIKYQQSTRLQQLLRLFENKSVYAESVDLSMFLAQKPGCPSSWGINIYCTSPLPLPNIKKLKTWAQEFSHQDEITQKVLTAIVWPITMSLWMNQQSTQAIEIGYAALGQDVPAQVTYPVPWWSPPPYLWQQPPQTLIGSPSSLQVLLRVLTGDLRF